MKTKAFDTPRPLLNWVLSRGREILTFQVRRAGNRYQVLVMPRGQNQLYARFLNGPKAFRLHAALVADFRDAGWTSVAYR
jgi:hypothetical protein